ncbi:hypothetical protein IFU00_19560 [Oxalobacteraceae sp. CFBP 8761]|jgi:hypothetical protein|nr:hypothetical protein [Oxalobacteraceae sp. CFBP 8761]
MGLYENRAVLFLDILGFSDLVQSGREERLLGILQHLQGRALEARQADKLDFTAFSDCVVVSAPVNEGKGVLQIVAYAQFLALDLLANRLLTRGAVVVGNLYHDGAIVLGPALVDAYKLESKKALYPRILVSHSVLGLVADATPHLREQGHSVPYYFREDFDGSYHIDIFVHGANTPEMYWGDVGTNGKVDRNAFRDSLQLFISRVYSSPPPSVAAEKYAWLARYFLEVCQANLWPIPENLPVSQSKRIQYEQELRDIHLAERYGDRD